MEQPDAWCEKPAYLKHQERQRFGREEKPGEYWIRNLEELRLRSSRLGTESEKMLTILEY